MEFENSESKVVLSNLETIYKKTQTDIELIDEYLQHMNRVYHRDPDSFLIENTFYLQIGSIKKQLNETMKEINEMMDKLNEFKQLKSKLEEINKCSLLGIV